MIAVKSQASEKLKDGDHVQVFMMNIYQTMVCTIYGHKQNKHEHSLKTVNAFIDGHSLTRHTKQVFLDQSTIRLDGTSSSLRIIGTFL